MNYRSLADLNHIIRSMPIPRVDAVAGIPRSGMLAASLIALHHHLPLADLNSLVMHRVFTGGPRGPAYPKLKTALVVDDSVLSGRALKRAKTALLHSTLQIYYAGIFVEPAVVEHVDFYGELLPRPRLFEWNILHHAILSQSCVDIDGVLCTDPTTAQNDDGPRYREFLQTAEPKYLPSVPLGWVVTSRLEKYRGLTADWLQQYGVQYKQLIMLDAPNAAARRGQHARHKAAAYKQTGAKLFLESSATQAKQIAALTGKSVFCLESWSMYAA
jgi:orotate phosphoribosyltransferase